MALARASLSITRIGFGAASIGGLFDLVDATVARAAIDRAWDLGLRYFDTAPLYGYGLSEERLGEALVGRPRSELVVSTKVGRLLRPAALGKVTNDDVFAGVFDREAPFDFSRDGILRSISGSLERLKLDRIDIAFMHDPDDHWRPAIETAYPTLQQLRDEGTIRAIGVGMNQAAMLARFVREADIDIVLCAGRYTLLDQAALTELLPTCAVRGVDVVIGGILNSGLLAGPRSNARFDYAPAPPERVAQAIRIQEVCERHSVPLRAAAIQFPFAHPAVTSVLAGVRTVEHLEDIDRLARMPIPDALWRELKDEGLIAVAAPTP